jgi:hypothetical protein
MPLLAMIWNQHTHNNFKIIYFNIIFASSFWILKRFYHQYTVRYLWVPIPNKYHGHRNISDFDFISLAPPKVAC